MSKSALSDAAQRTDDLKPALQPENAIEPIGDAAAFRPGRPLFIPVRISGQAAPESMVIRSDAGKSETISIRYLGTRPISPDPGAIARFDQWAWIGPQVDYMELSAEQVRQWHQFNDPAHTIVAFAQIEEPAQLAPGVHFGPRRVRLIPMQTPKISIPDDGRPDPNGPLAQWRVPDRRSPWEHFRRALYIRIRQPTEKAADTKETGKDSDIEKIELTDLLARQMTDQWLTALAELAVIDRELEAALVDRLVCHVWDEAVIVAAWPAGARELAQLDDILLSRLIDRTDDEPWRVRIKAWLDRQPATLHWIEHDSGSFVSLASVNLTPNPLTAQAQWADQPLTVEHIPLPSRQIVRRPIARPDDRPLDRLVVTSASRAWSLALGEPNTPVLPPGVEDGRFHQAMTLDHWYVAATQPIAPDDPLRSALAVQRDPDSGSWQVIVHASTVGNFVNDDDQFHSFAAFSEWSDLVGHEAITIFIGPVQSPLLIVSANPAGQWKEWTRSMSLHSDLVHIFPTADGWSLTFTLPDAMAHAPVLDVGIVRTHHTRPRVDSLPHGMLPWRPNPGRRRFDLTIWDPLPAP